MMYAAAVRALTIEQAIVELRQGKVIAYPTEAVWGLGCDPDNAQAVQTLLQLKNRPVEKGVILVMANYAQLEPLLAESLTAQQRQLLQTPTEKPTTWLVPFNAEKVPRWISGKHDTVAVRISTHPTVKALCEGFGKPLVSTSANPQAAQPAREAFQVRRYFNDKVAICRGNTGKALQPSTIIDLLSGAIIRG
jgi:L-threonylcarbamoyladenylate synthase